MKYLKLFEAFNSNFDPYQEVSQVEYENWSQNHASETFKKSDTLAILEIIDSLWNKKSLDIDFIRIIKKLVLRLEHSLEMIKFGMLKKVFLLEKSLPE